LRVLGQQLQGALAHGESLVERFLGSADQSNWSVVMTMDLVQKRRLRQDSPLSTAANQKHRALSLDPCLQRVTTSLALSRAFNVSPNPSYLSDKPRVEVLIAVVVPCARRRLLPRGRTTRGYCQAEVIRRNDVSLLCSSRFLNIQRQRRALLWTPKSAERFAHG
jgi:hypothetical protein